MKAAPAAPAASATYFFLREKQKRRHAPRQPSSSAACQQTNMISTLHWVPKGAAKAEPEQYELSPDDLRALQEKFAQQYVTRLTVRLAAQSGVELSD